MLEAGLKRKVMSLLKEKVIPADKIPGSRFKRGAADIIACVPPSGIYLAIELKSPEKKDDSPTEQQARFIDKINKAGGIAICSNDYAVIAGAIETVLDYSKRRQG